jgi:hypothetical protein
MSGSGKAGGAERSSRDDRAIGLNEANMDSIRALIRNINGVRGGWSARLEMLLLIGGIILAGLMAGLIARRVV